MGPRVYQILFYNHSSADQKKKQKLSVDETLANADKKVSGLEWNFKYIKYQD